MPRDLSARLLTEAGPEIGLGHLARCVALYDALEALGCSCQLFVAGETSEQIVEGRVVHIAEWRSPGVVTALLAGADIAVVDSYHAESDTYVSVAESVSAAAYIDDTARLAYPRGLVVNGNPNAASLAWSTRMDADSAFGTDHQLLRREFVDLPYRLIRPAVERALLLPGSARDGESALRWFEAAATAVFRMPALLGGRALRRAVEMRDAMLATDVAVSAAGQTLYELVATGTPTVAVVLADNQLAQAEALDRAGAILYAGEWWDEGTPERVVALLGTLKDAGAREALSSAAREVIDGRGAERVAKMLIARTERS